MKKVTTLYKINTVLVVAMALALPAACIYGIVDEAIHPAKLEARREKAAEHRHQKFERDLKLCETKGTISSPKWYSCMENRMEYSIKEIEQGFDYRRKRQTESTDWDQSQQQELDRATHLH